MKRKKSVKRVKRKQPFSCDICLIVYNTTLLHTKYRNLVKQDDALSQLTATELAQAAQRILSPMSAKKRQRKRIALALPNSEFVATSLQLPAVATQNLHNVVRLQLPTLLPGATESQLLLAVQAPPDGETTCALWIPVQRVEELWQAFNQVGLSLICVVPRSVVVLPRKFIPWQIHDEDDNSITYLEWSGNVIQRWLHLPKKECDISEFQAQWQELQSTLPADIQQVQKLAVSDWEDLPLPSPATYDYAFVPPSTKARWAQAIKRKRRVEWILLMMFLVGGIIWGIYYAMDYQQKQKQYLVDLQRRNLNVSQLQAEVAEIEAQIGPVKHFPRQEVVSVLLKLNQLIPKDSWIISFHIEAGVIKLEGYSPKPTQLVEILSEVPELTDVEGGDLIIERKREEYKFTIQLKLKHFDLKPYWLEYFPDKSF
jgi:hypothetical protein